MKYLAWLLSFSIGFLSMTQEILWVRLVGFAFQGIPQAFALVLTLFLAGISLGALIGKELCFRVQHLAATAAIVLCVAGSIDLALVQIIPLFHDYLGLFGFGVLILLAALLKGIIFPIAHHIGSTLDNRLGRSVAWVYFMNILGSTLGPLLVGLLLLDILSITATLRLLAYGTLFTAAGIYLFGVCCSSLVHRVGIIFGLIIIVVIGRTLDTQDPYLVVNLANGRDDGIKNIIENRHGIIHTVQGKHENDDIVYGGNVYDGHTNIDLRINSNRINRAYLIHVLQPSPSRVLMIGLSSGAWARILLSNPAVKTMDVVEINPGYLQLIRSYPHLSPILDDRRVKIHIDDGRRWLRHQEASYDLIVMNTTFHWRANTTNLLSKEMLTLIRDHLNRGGLLAFNATGSSDAFFTASRIFPHTYRYTNFIYAGNYDFRNENVHAKMRLSTLMLENKPVFSFSDQNDLNAINTMMGVPFESIEEVKAASTRMLEEITDQNMLTEFKYGRQLF